MTDSTLLGLSLTPLMVLGILLVFGSIGGHIAHRISWLPSISGFMFIGLLIGPSCLGILNVNDMQESRILIDIAVGLILYRLGLSLDIKTLKKMRWIFLASLIESMVSFTLVLYVLTLFSIPLIIAALIAAITVSSSPAVLLHIAKEVNASGKVTDTAMMLVAMNNLFAFVAFSLVLPFVHSISGADWPTILFQPFYRFFGSIFLSSIIAFALHHIAIKTSSSPQYRLALIIGGIMIAIGIAHQLNLSMLLSTLALGFFIRNLERETLTSNIEFGEAFELFFIILFVYAGAGLHISELFVYWPAIMALVLARGITKVVVIAFTKTASGWRVTESLSCGMLLLPMASLAVGLTQTVNTLFPEHAPVISTIVLGSVAVLETIGPPIALMAFRLCGEAGNNFPNIAHEANREEP